jgi:hypothetical protein
MTRGAFDLSPRYPKSVYLVKNNPIESVYDANKICIFADYEAHAPC